MKAPKLLNLIKRVLSPRSAPYQSLQNFNWPAPEDESDKRIIANIKQSGCQAMGIGDDTGEGIPPYVHSIGFHLSYQQPEVLVLGVNGETGRRVIEELNRHFRKGQRIAAGTTITLSTNRYKFRDVPSHCLSWVCGLRSLVLWSEC